MAIPDDVLGQAMDHVGGTELESRPAARAIGHESDFVKEQVVLALAKEPALEATRDIAVNVTDDEILITAPWSDSTQQALAERIARSLAVGRVVRSGPGR